MRILFLDMDGVVNSEAYLLATHEESERAVAEATGHAQWRLHSLLMIDPEAVKLVDEIVERADAHVVVSSTWRIRFEPHQIWQLLRDRGSKMQSERFIGRTPNDRTGDEVRGHEIQRWLDKHPEVERFVILDDDSDMIHLMPRLVQTNWEHGIEREHVERAVAMLRGEQ